MIPVSALRDVLTIVVESETGPADDYGNPTMEVVSTLAVRAQVNPTSTREIEDGRDTRLQLYDVIVGADTDVDGLSSVTWNGKSMEVVGEPKEFFARGLLHHLEFQVREILG